MRALQALCALLGLAHKLPLVGSKPVGKTGPSSGLCPAGKAMLPSQKYTNKTLWLKGGRIGRFTLVLGCEADLLKKIASGGATE